MTTKMKCCVPGCVGSKYRSQRFPHPEKDWKKRFSRWIDLIGSRQLQEAHPMYVYKNKRICLKHFSAHHFLMGSPGKYLNKEAVPDLFLPEKLKPDLPLELKFMKEEGNPLCTEGYGYQTHDNSNSHLEEMQKEQIEKQLLKEKLIKEELLEEDPLKEKLIKEEQLEEDPLKGKLIKEELLEEDPLKEKLIKEELLEEDPLKEEGRDVLLEEDPLKEENQDVKQNYIDNMHIDSVYPENKLFGCSHSDLKSDCMETLEKHKILHPLKKKCFNSLVPVSKPDLVRPMKEKHIGQKPFARFLCGQNCSERCIMNNSAYKPLACPNCDYRTFYSWCLKIHTLKHTEEKPLACSFRDYGPTSRVNLERHKKKHNKNKDGNSTRVIEGKDAEVIVPELLPPPVNEGVTPVCIIPVWIENA